MRHTLIPTDLKKSLRHEYRVRAIIVLLFMMSVAWVIGVVSLLPSFVHVKSEKDTAMKTLASLENISGNRKGDGLVVDVAKQAAMLKLFDDQPAGKTLNSMILTSIVSVRGSVKLNSISITRPATTTIAVTILGEAPTRDALINFKNSLTGAISGNKVDLPISELAKSKDVQFSLTLTNATMP